MKAWEFPGFFWKKALNSDYVMRVVLFVVTLVLNSFEADKATKE